MPESSSRFGLTRLYRDAGSIASSNIANAVLGLAFWAVAARIIPPESLGVMTAVLAVIVATSVVVASGFGDAYAAILPAIGAARPRLYRRGQRKFFLIAAIVGLAAAAATTVSLAEVRGSVAVALLVAAGILAWATLTLQNATLVALGRARWLPAANIATSLVKIALLPLLAVTIAWHAIELSFAISAVLVAIVLAPAIRRVVDMDEICHKRRWTSSRPTICSVGLRCRRPPRPPEFRGHHADAIPRDRICWIPSGSLICAGADDCAGLGLCVRGIGGFPGRPCGERARTRF